MKIETKLDIYEIDGEHTEELNRPGMTITNHWNSSSKVNLRLGDGKEYTVLASELIRAIENATN